MKIALRLKPLSHLHGEQFLLPGTTIVLRCFPTRIEGEDLEGKIPPFWIEYSWTGPVKQFTAELDCQRGELRLFGFSQEGYFAYRLQVQEGSFVLHVDKSPTATFCTSSLFAKQNLKTITLFPIKVQKSSSLQQLSLGSHKAQDIVKIKERLDPCELFPLWLKVADLSPQREYTKGKKGHYALLQACAHKNKREIVTALLQFFQTAFHGCFVPRLIDTEYQGIVPTVQEKASVLPLLLDSAELIRSLFYKEIAPHHIELLPCLPQELPCGRFTDIRTKEGVQIDLEWRKHQLRSVCMKSQEACVVRLTVPKGSTSCRLNKRHKVSIEERTFELPLKAKERICLDLFK